MIFVGFGLVSAIGPSHAADGADHPTGAVAARDWSGAYIGVSGGFDQFDGSYSSLDLDRTAALDTANEGSADGRSFGLVAGYDAQRGAVVYGIEASLSRPDARIVYVDNYTPDYSWGYAQSVTSLAMLRGRVGFSIGDTLVYGAAGLAAGQVRVTGYDTFVDPAGGGITDWRGGWTVGLGLERRIGDGWSATVEYREIGLAALTHQPDYWYKPFEDTHELRLQQVALGMKYRF
jgi:outer membrane immunogenic protein